ncbi:MAG TPA: serine/threonine-protein kinase, partial [Steroidobacteraceae bacterium]|nr:serine/threonine-protein kinase [Steroidobacteraceae bacterium]
AEGVPYVVMEFVDGTPIDEYCNRARLSIRDRLVLFRTVCAAVQYAHQNLIVHRDLKPGNILVTAKGEPKLLDFGIAKIRDPHHDAQNVPAVTMLPMMTPEFASPEQVRGEAVTTSSDTYSLGVILYLLLTGRPPYRVGSRSAHDVIKAVCETEPARPSTVVGWSAVSQPGDAQSAGNPQDRAQAPDRARRRGMRRLRRMLRGELDNIVLMALRKEPERRYRSVEQFSDDVRRYLDNQPVAASRDTWRYRFWKFLLRHRAGVAATALVILSLAAGLVLTWREAGVAQRRFNDVDSLANSMIFDIHDAISDLPGSTAARKLVVERALQYLDKMAQESHGDDSLEREVAAGYERIGDVQGNTFAANLGDTAGALRSYRKALALRQAVHASHEDNIADTVALARSLRLVANAVLLTGDTAGARSNSELAVSTAEQAALARGGDVAALEELRQDYATEAAILGGNYNMSNFGDFSAALSVREKELAVAERISALEPGSLSAEESVARSLAHMGDQLSMVGRRHASLEHYLRAGRMFEDLAQRAPGTKALQTLQAIYNRLYFAQYSDGDKAGALASARRAFEIAKELTRADPNDFRSRVSLVIDDVNLATVLSATGALEEARVAASEALSTISNLASHNPANGEIPGLQASADITASDVMGKAGDAGRALGYARTAVGIFTRRAAEDPSSLSARLDLATGYSALGKLLLQMHDLDGATDSYRKSLALSEPQINSQRPSEESLYIAAESYAELGLVAEQTAAIAQTPQRRTEQLNAARSWYARSLDVWSRVKEPKLLSPAGYECIPPSLTRERLDSLTRSLHVTS